MSSNKFIEVNNAGFGDEKSLEELNLMCNDEVNASKTYLAHINETVRYLNAIGINCDSLTVRAYFSTFYATDDIVDNRISGNAKPLDDKAVVDFMVINIPFESKDQEAIYYEYIFPAIDKKHHVSFSKFSKMLDTMGVEFSFPKLEEIGKYAMHGDLYECDTKIQLSQDKLKQK